MYVPFYGVSLIAALKGWWWERLLFAVEVCDCRVFSPERRRS